MLTASEIITEVRRDLDETDANNSYWSDADLIAYLNRVLADVSDGLPVRTIALRFTGDGTTNEFSIPEAEHVSEFHTLLDNFISVPKVSYARALRESGIYSTLPYYFGDYGFAPVQRAGRQSIRIVPTLESGATRDAYVVALLGKVKETPYATGTVSITNGDATVTGSGTTWTGGNVNAGESIAINGHYYVVQSVTSATELELTELVRESTASGLSYSAGSDTGIHRAFQEMVVEGVKYHARRKEGARVEAMECRAEYERQYAIQRGQLEVLLTNRQYLGTA